ncbi:MAG: segregation/condensation protein A [Clostridia bacterium]|nr:segregation/condensation protein A [Clostridia bacterium]
MEITYHLSQFDGPLDMLLFMLEKSKIDIRDIFISEITDQYIQAVKGAPDLDMEEASAFIAVAARLLEIKSHKLLPQPEPETEEDPETAFIRQLEEYAAFKRIALDMQAFEKTAALVYHKLPEEYPLPPPSYEITGLTLEGLIAAFARVMARIPGNEDEERPERVRSIIRDEYTVPMCMARILRKVRRGSISFPDLAAEHASRAEIVTLFLAMLELLKLGKITCMQDSTYGNITVSCA